MKGIIFDDNYDFILSDATDFSTDYDASCITTGWVIDDNSTQTAHIALSSLPGECKADPEAGTGLRLLAGGQSDPFLTGTIKTQLKRQKLSPHNVKVSETGITIDF